MPFYELEVFPAGPDRSFGSKVSGINADGDVVGTSFFYGQPQPGVPEQEMIATVWDDASHDLIDSPGIRAAGYDINDRDDVVGVYGDQSGWPRHGFAVVDGQMVDFATALTSEYSSGSAINNHAVVVGSVAKQSGHHLFRWDVDGGGGPEVLGQALGATTSGAAINDDGTILASVDPDDGGNRGALYKDGTFIDLGTMFHVWNIGPGDVVVGGRYFEGEDKLSACRIELQNGQPMVEKVGKLPGASTSTATDVNADGHIVGYSGEYNGPWRGFIHRDGEIHDLNDLVVSLAGWKIETAMGINDDGVIAVELTRPNEKRGGRLRPIGVEDDPKRPPLLDEALMGIILFGVIEGGGGVIVLPGGGGGPVDPTDPLKLSRELQERIRAAVSAQLGREVPREAFDAAYRRAMRRLSRPGS